MPSLFRIHIPHSWHQSSLLRASGVYLSGALFAAGFWVLLDGAILSRSPKNGSTLVHVRFVDWLPFIAGTLGMGVINLIDKQQLGLATNGEYYGLNNGSSGGGEAGTAWKARLALFLGFSLLAGGLAGSVVVLVLKYVLPHYQMPTLWLGISNVVASGLVMISTIVLWIGQSVQDDYTYSLSL